MAEDDRGRVKLLAIVGSQREYGNSFLLAKEALNPFEEVDYETVQLARKDIQFCNVCGTCESAPCPVEDDFSEILEKMLCADGIIFAYPKYLFTVPTRLLCFLERLDVFFHLRKYPGYTEELRLGQNVSPLLEGKPCCLLAVTDPGESAEECLRMVGQEAGNLGMKLVLLDSQIGAHAVGKFRGEVLTDKKGIEDCRRLVRNLIDSIGSRS